MVSLLTVPAKKGYDVDLVKPISTYIDQNYTGQDFKSELKDFDRLRRDMLQKSFETHKTSLESLNQYYDQFCALESKIPMTENQVRIPFKWQDAFGKDSLFGGKKSLTLSSGGYEKMCVLFNIASMMTHLGAERLDDDDGLKNSAKYFQQAAGIFQWLKDAGMSLIQQDPTPDLYSDTLNVLVQLCLGQAQEVIYHKAVKDKMKSLIIAKISAQVTDYYADCLKKMQVDELREMWPKDWVKFVAGKQAAFHALSEYYQAKVAKESKQFGKEIGHLEHAKSLLASAETRGAGTVKFTDYANIVNNALQAAIKDNNFIYHDTVPEKSQLGSCPRANLVKCLPLEKQMSSNFKDIFVNLVPVAVQQALASFNDQKGNITQTEIGRIREQNQILNALLASLNLPAALEDSSGDQVPQSVLDKAVQVRQKGGIEKINELMDGLPELLTRNREILDEAVKMLNEEEESDKNLCQKFGEQWTRTPSEKLTEPIRSEAAKYRTIIDNAIQADHVVKEKYAKCRIGIEVMSKSDMDIKKALPSGGGLGNAANAPVVQKLRKLMEDVEAIKAERQAIENELQNTVFDDITVKFMSALASDQLVNEQGLAHDNLQTVYGPLREQITASGRRQEELLEQIRNTNSEFIATTGNKAADRSKMLSDLASSYDVYIELLGNLEEGNKFYNDLTEILLKFQNKVSDFCFARKTEKEELMKDLQTAVANKTSGPPPTRPPTTYKAQEPTQPSSSATVPPSSAPAPAPPTSSNSSAPPAAAAASQPYSPPVLPAGYNPWSAPPPQAPYGYPPYSGYPQQQPYQPYPAYPQAQQGYPYPQQQQYPPQYPPQGYQQPPYNYYQR